MKRPQSQPQRQPLQNRPPSCALPPKDEKGDKLDSPINKMAGIELAQNSSPLPNLSTSRHTASRQNLRVIPMGGVEEVGENMTVLEYGDDLIIIDMGLAFPDDTMPGIDYIIPDTKWLEENKRRIRGVIITHGHLDHIGAVPYILPKLGDPPVYTMALTAAFVKKRLICFIVGLNFLHSLAVYTSFIPLNAWPTDSIVMELIVLAWLAIGSQKRQISIMYKTIFVTILLYSLRFQFYVLSEGVYIFQTS